LYTNEVNFQPLSVNNVVNLGYLASEFLLHELAFFCRNSLVLTLGGTYFFFFLIKIFLRLVLAASVCKVFSYAFECDDILRLCCLDFIYQVLFFSNFYINKFNYYTAFQRSTRNTRTRGPRCTQTHGHHVIFVHQSGSLTPETQSLSPKLHRAQGELSF
jgi:hypothetical protein